MAGNSKLSADQVLGRAFDATLNALRTAVTTIASAIENAAWDSATEDLDLSTSSVHRIDLGTTAVTTLTLSSPADGGRYTLIFDTDDPAAVTWPANVNWPGGTAPTFTTDGVDIVTLLYDETEDEFFGTFSQDFQ